MPTTLCASKVRAGSFGGPVTGAGTVYQQIYAASNFSGAGNLLSVSFFEAP